MTLARFVTSLLHDGRVRVSNAFEMSGTARATDKADLADTAKILTEFESEYRQELPGVPPELDQESMMWSAQLLFQICSYLAHREVEIATMNQLLQTRCPHGSSPATCYSVDLTLRFLPDLIRLAKANSDPLVEGLLKLGQDWPLSSVGVAEISDAHVEPIVSHKCLLKMYVDRIILTRDQSRLNHPAVELEFRVAVGGHREFAPKFDSPSPKPNNHDESSIQ